MRIRIDESGQFNFTRPKSLALCVVAAVAIPDSQVGAVEEFVAARKLAWEMPRELKAAEMEDEQLLEVAEFFVAQDLRLVGILSDSETFDIKAQVAHREAQVAEFEASVVKSETAAGDLFKSAQITRLRTRLHNTRHISAADFFQYQVLMPWLLARGISAGPIGFPELLPPQEGWQFDIAVDPRAGADPGKAGQALRDSVGPIFAGDERTALLIPAEWGVEHPFYLHNAAAGTKHVTARIFGEGIRTPHSHEDAGLQLADYAAHVLHSVALRGEQAALAAWTHLARLTIPTDEGWPLKVRAPLDADQSPWERERYRRFLL